MYIKVRIKHRRKINYGRVKDNRSITWCGMERCFNDFGLKIEVSAHFMPAEDGERIEFLFAFDDKEVQENE